MVTTITSDGDVFANEVHTRLTEAGLRSEIDLRNEKINFKVREHSVAKVPVILVVGRREAEDRTVSMRRLGSKEQEVLALDDVVSKLVQDAADPIDRAQSI